MKKLLSRLIWLPLGLALVLFLVANRQLVAISLDPFSVDAPAISTPALPLWAWLMTMLMIGYFLGAATSWVGGRGQRKKARSDRKELKTLRREQEFSEATRPTETGDNLPVLKTS